MPRKCCTPFCKTGYATCDEIVPIYGFPKDSDGGYGEEGTSWRNSLPNQITKITKNTGICRHYWPQDAEMILRHRHLIPKDTPSVFPETTSSMLPQTYNSK